jgi:hypothetical protein
VVRFFRYPGCSWRYPFIASPLKNLSELYDEQLPDKYKVELDQYFRPSLAINFPFWKADKIIKNSAHHKKQLFHPDSIFIYPGVQIFFSSLKFCLKFLWVELFNWIIFLQFRWEFVFLLFEDRRKFLNFSKFITKAQSWLDWLWCNWLKFGISGRSPHLTLVRWKGCFLEAHKLTLARLYGRTLGRQSHVSWIQGVPHGGVDDIWNEKQQAVHRPYLAPKKLHKSSWTPLLTPKKIVLV